MEKIVAQYVFDGLTPEQYETTLRDLEARGLGKPKGRLYHIAIKKDNGMEVIALWDSQQSLDEFSKDLLPILQKKWRHTSETEYKSGIQCDVDYKTVVAYKFIITLLSRELKMFPGFILF